ncbi:efflux RND transporter periplasmic adaptor subunit [Roseateles sp.]|jgi:HlyD family secretion protein|uniref:efflux RND transporter periplasmic adaptor subunit n=1 Tax=Roseateles sp. TaxID=1971397 RepID=UPI0037CB9375
MNLSLASLFSRRRLLWLAGFAVLAVALLLWSQRRPQVEVLPLQAAPMLSSLQLSARVAARSRVEVGSTLTGRVQQVLVREGDSVAAGQALVRLESDELAASLSQAQASERAASARLAGLRSSGRSGLQAGVAQAQSVLLAAEADLKRQQSLVAQGFVSEARLDEARRAVAVARAQNASAQAQLQGNQDQGGSDIAQAEAQLAQARAATAAAAAKLAQATLTAPAAGRVLARSAEPGQIVQPGRALLSLALDGPTELLAQLDERYLAQLRVGQTAQVLADAYPKQRFAATVQRIAPLVDAQRGSVELRLALAPPVPAFLREDMTLSVEVETGRREQALVLPLQALRGEGADGDATVWLINADGRVEARRVKLGLRTLEAAEVLQGLQAGDQLMLGTAAQPGQRVRTRPASTLLPAAASSMSKDSRDAGGSVVSNAMGR